MQQCGDVHRVTVAMVSPRWRSFIAVIINGGANYDSHIANEASSGQMAA